MGFLGLIPSIKVFTDNSTTPHEEDTPSPVDPPDSAVTQKSFESLKVSNSKQSGSSSENHQQDASPVSVAVSEDRSSMDPLSHLILKRVGTSQSLKSHQPSNQSIKSHQTSAGPTSIPVTNQSPSHSGTADSGNSVNANRFLENTTAEYPPRKSQQQTKGTFFSKLLKNSSGRPTIQDERDSINFDKREEGWKADVFGFVPNFPTPPKYIHVRAHRKQKREMNRVFLAQELNPSEFNAKNSAIWCAKFSHDGKYMATAGEDQVLRVWQVLSSPKDREEMNESEEEDGIVEDNESVRRHFKRGGGGGSKRVYAPVFKPRPIREYYGHTGDILDISWSKNNFLLSSSMDKTVRLWHIERAECLCSFLHADFVTAIRFHPKDDRFFLSGSLDCKIRLWSIPDKEVAFSKDVPDLITAVAFTPDGFTSIVGCFGGQCLFYETDGLHFQSQMHVRSSRGRNSKGSKITGIESIILPREMLRAQASFDSETKLLISTNDSRVRLYNLYDKTMEAKFKGHENEQSQIHASFSDNGEYIISGSEDDRTYIWRTQASHGENAKRKDIQEYEYFHSNKSMVTVAKFAPTMTKRILASSDDPVYDLCDPPPVKLMPRDEESVSDESNNHNTSTPQLRPETKKSKHNNGNIIVTADREGIIKIFRQDCAYEPRKQYLDSGPGGMQRKRISSGLSPTHSWRESLSIYRSRSLRGSSPSTRYPRLGSSERVPTSVTESTTSRGRSRIASPTPSAKLSSLHKTPDQSPSGRGRSPAKKDAKGDDVHCHDCNGTEFNAKKIDGVVRLVCTTCESVYQ